MSTPVVVLECTAEQHAQEGEPFALSAYRYAEFTGPGGERYLKKLLRQILPMALYRTWEIFTDHQARGNDCYLSISQLAALAGRSLRTMQKDLASLQAKALLVERAERKVFHGAERASTSRMVVVKDFAALYTLAHEYHEWLSADAYIPPDRAFLSVLSQDRSLVAKLRRFNNYRRVLYTQLPGPGPRAQEEDRWFTEYLQEASGPTKAQQEVVGDAQPAVAHLPQTTPNDPAKERSKASPKRSNEISQRDVSSGVSFDSVASFSEKSLEKKEAGSGKQPDQPPDIQNRAAGPARASSAVKQARTQMGHFRSRRPAGSSRPTRQPEETSAGTHTAQQAVTGAGPKPPDRIPVGLVQNTSLPRPPDHALARSLVHEIAAPFGNRNPKGSTTRVLRIIAGVGLEEAEVLLCLVRAYTIARDTRTLRHTDPATGHANRMPLFCTLFERFVQARVHRSTWNYPWQQMEEDLAADDRLLLWWTEHQARLAKETPNPHESQSVPVPGVQADQSEPDEDAPLVVGWARREAAHSWGEQLLEALIAAGYEAEVRVHLEGQWYQLLLVSEECEWVLDTPQKVQSVTEQLQQGGP